jgi:hypothetical protein
MLRIDPLTAVFLTMGAMAVPGQPMAAGKKVPVYPVTASMAVDGNRTVTALPIKVDVSSYSNRSKSLKDDSRELSRWIYQTSTRSLGALLPTVPLDAAETAPQIDAIVAVADQFVGGRLGPSADTTLLHHLPCKSGSSAALVQHLQLNLDRRGFWNSQTGGLGVGMSNLDLRGALLDCHTGEVLWRGELYVRDIPRVGEKKFEEYVAHMFDNLEIRRTRP